jgi:hypothetical protein
VGDDLNTYRHRDLGYRLLKVNTRARDRSGPALDSDPRCDCGVPLILDPAAGVWLHLATLKPCPGRGALRTALRRMSFDPGDAPPDPPDECMLPFLWRVAQALQELHYRTGTGACHRCGTPYPCEPSRIAVHGLLIACGLAVPDGGPS